MSYVISLTENVLNNTEKMDLITEYCIYGQDELTYMILQGHTCIEDPKTVCEKCRKIQQRIEKEYNDEMEQEYENFLKEKDIIYRSELIEDVRTIHKSNRSKRIRKYGMK